MKLIINKKHPIIRIPLLLGCFLIFSTSCKGVAKISENEKNEIKLFVDSFYEFLDNNPKPEDIKNWFLDEQIEFYIQDNSRTGRPLRIVTDNSETMFISMKSDFLTEAGKMTNKEVNGIKFEKQIYDVAQSDLFVAKYHVIYERLEAHETFFLKKENQGYKIFRYFINYNS